jgi:Flp pilus assembly protein TadB
MSRLKKADLLKAAEDKSKEKPKKRMNPISMLYNFLQKRAETKYHRKNIMKEQMEKAGFDLKPSAVSKILVILSIIANTVLSAYLVKRFYADFAYDYVITGIMFIVVWVLMFAVVFFVLWLLFYFLLDIAIFKRKQKLEEVLPDFLQLASSNIRAGMTVDQALWFAVRPRFGVLAKEIEEVAKRTFAGEPLDVALNHFVKKYDSKVLARSMSLLLEGLNAGGEIGNLLTKISENIQETNVMKKELAANVTTYVIFITFATLIAAPFLFGMAFQLIIVIQEVFSRVNIAPGTVSGFSVTITEGVISRTDFKTFAIVSLMITSLFSSIIISTIKKGNVKAGARYIPMFMAGAVALFLIVVKLFSYFVEGFF